MKPAYQGQIDVFCAAYAVLNAMRFIHETRLLECRAFFHEALLQVSRDEEQFRAILSQQTDYVDWVDAMLHTLRQKRLLTSTVPFPTVFPGPHAVPPETIWETLQTWLDGGSQRVALFQFVRHLIPGQVVIRHWTCALPPSGTTLPLFDCSLEPGSVQRIEKEQLITDESRGVTNKILIVPYTIRLLSPLSERRR